MPKHRTTPLTADKELIGILSDARQQGISYAAICEHAGIDQSTLWRWRQGKASPVLSEWRKVTEAIAHLQQAKQNDV